VCFLALDPIIQVLRLNVVRLARIVQDILSEAHGCILSRLSLLAREDFARHSVTMAPREDDYEAEISAGIFRGRRFLRRHPIRSRSRLERCAVRGQISFPTP